MGKSRQSEHKQFLDWLVNQAIEQSVDVILVAGDIFDTGSPPSYARELYNYFFVALRERDTYQSVHVIVLAGNHDSVATLSEAKDLLLHFNVNVIAGLSNNLEEHVIQVKSKSGQLKGLVCAIPYLRPRDLVESNAGQTGRQKQQDLQEAIFQFKEAVYQKAAAIRKKVALDIPIISSGHLMVAGGSCSDSVRDIYVGTLDAFPALLLPPADYTALGHIHMTQQIKAPLPVHYCGSPIALSFDELKHQKHALLVMFEGHELSAVTRLQIPRFQQMRQIKGNIETVESEIELLIQVNEEENPEVIWLDVEVDTQDYLSDLQQRIEGMLKGSTLEVLMLRRAKKRRLQSIDYTEKLALSELSPKDVFEQRLALENWDGEQKQQKARLLSTFDTLLSTLESSDDIGAGAIGLNVSHDEVPK